MIQTEKIETLEALRARLASLPDGTTCDVLASDLEAGNFEVAHFVLPAGAKGKIHYSGPVAEGYQSPFEMYKFTYQFASGQTETHEISDDSLDNEIQFANQQKNDLHKEGEDFIIDFSYKEIKDK